MCSIRCSCDCSLRCSASSHLTVRAPALLGAAIYIAASLLVCRKLTPDLHVQWPLFVCLVYNPFIFDHLVAARGYALALGLPDAMLCVAAFSRAGRGGVRACSICAALSFAANFSFAFADAFALLAILTWACARTQAIQTRVRLLGACVLPGLLVSVFLSVPVVLRWPKGQLEYGAHSLGEMFPNRRVRFDLPPESADRQSACYACAGARMLTD